MNIIRQLLVLECNIDDMNPEFFPPVIEQLLELGARDAWLTPIIMKAGRPAQTLSVLIEPAHRATVMALIFRETTTLGIRVNHIEREELSRELADVSTKYGLIPIKIARDYTGQVVNAAPELKVCRQLAQAAGVSLKLVYGEALRRLDPDAD